MGAMERIAYLKRLSGERRPVRTITNGFVQTADGRWWTFNAQRGWVVVDPMSRALLEALRFSLIGRLRGLPAAQADEDARRRARWLSMQAALPRCNRHRGHSGKCEKLEWPASDSDCGAEVRS